MSPGSCSVRSWKRSSGGTPIVSTSARWIASPTLRRYASGLPLTSEMRTSGMLAHQSLDRQQDQLVHRLGALALRLGAEAVDQARVVQDVFVGEFHGFLLGKRNGGLAERLDHGDAALAQPVAAAGLDHDVAQPVFLGDPYGSVLGAYRVAQAVDDFQHLPAP